ncbi:MAG TPA: diguanylate cyclase [Thermoanaerobaculia bacterium]|nr:diguanylate cyclase [Thermoanaerobaculia bacterium]
MRAWLFVGFAGLSTLPLLALSIGLAELNWRGRAEVARARLVGDAQAVVLAVDTDLDHLQKSLRSLAAALEQAEQADPATVNRLLARYHSHYPDFLTMLVADREGRISGSDPERGADGAPMVGRSIADREYYRRPMATGETFVSDVFQGRGFGSDLIIALSVPWPSAGGEVAGIVQGSLDLTRYGSILEPHVGPHGTEVFILDRTGRVVAARSGTPVKSMDLLVGNWSPTSPGEVVVRSFGGEDYLVASSRVEVSGWSVLARRPMALVARERRLSYRLAAGAIVLALVLASVVAWAASERAARPLLASERRYRDLVEQSFGLVCTHDLDGTILSVNPEGARAFGLPPEAVVGRNLGDIVHPETRAALADYLHRIREGGSAEGLMRVVTATGEERILMYRNRLVESEGLPPHVIGSAIDVTDRRRREERLADLALRDPLTGVANRALFQDRLHQALERARRYGHRVALVYLDLDNLKQINDRRGHTAGDAVLRQVAGRLEAQVRRVDTVARLGGDEFVVVLPEVGRQENAQQLTQAIRGIFEAPFEVEGSPLRATGSLGLALFPDDAENAETLLAAADERMYAAKRRSGGRWRLRAG